MEDRDICFVCGEENEHVLHSHHRIPRRYGGSEGYPNEKTLCANCHEAIEAMYDRWFWRQLGVFEEYQSLQTQDYRDDFEEIRESLEHIEENDLPFAPFASAILDEIDPRR